MVAQEQTMSHAKHEHSQFHHSAAARAVARTKPLRPDSWELIDPAELRVLESPENKITPNGDPYNGVGTRALTGRALRR
jgi:hypothetical protein